MFILVLLCFSGAAASAGDDVDTHLSCAFCGMDRKAYGYSRMLIEYADGTAIGVCSLHCAANELEANPSRAVASLFVADRNSRTLIDAEQAVWVMGGKKRGVMSEIPMWAFRRKDSADAFVKRYGGTIVL